MSIEMGQMLFGNKWEEHPAPEFISRDLYTLSEMVGRAVDAAALSAREGDATT